MEETSDFGNLLQSKLNYIVDSIHNPEELDEEELLFQIHCIDELLITLNNLYFDITDSVSRKSLQRRANLFPGILNEKRLH